MAAYAGWKKTERGPISKYALGRVRPTLHPRDTPATYMR